MTPNKLLVIALAVGLFGCGAPDDGTTPTGPADGGTQDAIAGADGTDTSTTPDSAGVDTPMDDTAQPVDAGADSGTDISVDAGTDLGAVDTGPVLTGSVVINELVSAPVAGESDWVELFNPGTEAADLSGWTMSDSDPLNAFAFPSGTVVEGGAYLVLERDAEGSFTFGLGPNDSVFLYDPTTSLVDFADWISGDAPEGASWGRFPNGTGPFGTLLTPTPGAENLQPVEPECGNGSVEFGEVCDKTNFEGKTCQTLGYASGDLVCNADCTLIDVSGCVSAQEKVAINELVAADPNAGPDWIELVNLGTSSIDLAGWSLTDSDPAHTFVFGAGATIESGQHLLLYQGAADSFDFGLAADDAVMLFNGDSILTDVADWTEGQAPPGASWGRFPDGTGEFQTLTSPTPGEANVANTPSSCGNGELEFGEVCDGDLLSGATCEDLGFPGGTLGCSDECTELDTSKCTLPESGIVLNEVTSSGDDQIELFNVGQSTVDLGGWRVFDSAGDVPDHVYVIPAGTKLGAGEYRVLVKDVDHTFGLASSDAVTLANDSGSIESSVAWEKGAAAVSYCRIPNGTGAFTSCTISSFGATNIQ